MVETGVGNGAQMVPVVHGSLVAEELHAGGPFDPFFLQDLESLAAHLRAHASGTVFFLDVGPVAVGDLPAAPVRQFLDDPKQTTDGEVPVPSDQDRLST